MLYLRNTLTQSEERRLQTPTVTDPLSADKLNTLKNSPCDFVRMICPDARNWQVAFYAEAMIKYLEGKTE